MFKTIFAVQILGWEFRVAKSRYWLAVRIGRYQEAK